MDNIHYWLNTHFVFRPERIKFSSIDFKTITRTQIM